MRKACLCTISFKTMLSPASLETQPQRVSPLNLPVLLMNSRIFEVWERRGTLLSATTEFSAVEEGLGGVADTTQVLSLGPAW